MIRTVRYLCFYVRVRAGVRACVCVFSTFDKMKVSITHCLGHFLSVLQFLTGKKGESIP